MPNDPSALAMQPDAPSDDEYQAFLLALSESARGRAFLAEHARRSRSEDSAMLLSSVQRLEGLVRGQADAPAQSPIDDVRGMLEAIRAVQAELDVSTLAMQVAKLAELIEGVQQRIDGLVVSAPPETPPEEAASQAEQTAAPADELDVEEATDFAAPEPEPAAAGDVEAEIVSDLLAEPEGALAVEALAEVAESEFDVTPQEESANARFVETALEPEPTPVADSAAAALIETVPEDDAAVDVPVAATDAAKEEAEPNVAIPEVAWSDDDAIADQEPESTEQTPAGGLAIAALVETLVVPEPEEPPPEAKVIKAGTIPPPPPFAGEDFSADKRARVVPPPVDPLADIKALSEEERVALFT